MKLLNSLSLIALLGLLLINPALSTEREPIIKEPILLPNCKDKSKSRSLCVGDTFNGEKINNQGEACDVLEDNPPSPAACDAGCADGGTNSSPTKYEQDDGTKCCKLTVTRFCD